MHWIHNKYSGIKDTLCPGPDFNYASCLGIASSIDGTEKIDVEVGDDGTGRIGLLFRDMVSGGGCELAVVTSHQLLPLLANHNLSRLTRVYLTCAGSVMFHAAESWVMTMATLKHLRCYGRAMICFICNVKLALVSLLSNLDIQSLDAVLRTSGMRWFRHVERSDGRIAQVCNLHRRDNAGQKTWDEVWQDDRKKLGMDLATL